MTNQQILKKAIKKAIGGGYNGKLPVASDSPSHEWHPYGLIFNHDFARALWGEDMENYTFRQKAFGSYRPAWQGHLMQMVIAEDPIKYLEQNI